MNDLISNEVFWLSIFMGLLGAIIITGVILFGKWVYGQISHYRNDPHLWIDVLFHRAPNLTVTAVLNSLNHLKEVIANDTERRNEFWTIYGQIILAIFIVTILAILLITKTISAEAGLPILSAITGFAIAKGVNTGSRQITSNDPNDRENG